MATSFDARTPFGSEGQNLDPLSSRLSHTASHIAHQATDGSPATIRLVCGLDKPRSRMRLLGAAGADYSPECSCVTPADGAVDEALHGQVSWHDDLPAWPRTRLCSALHESKAVSRLVLPLATDQAMTGVVQLCSQVPRRYLPHEIEAMRRSSLWWAMALENARLFDRTAALFRLANTLSTTMEQKAIGNVIAAQVAKAMGVKGATLRSLNRPNRTLDLIGSHGLSQAYLSDKGPVIAGENLADVLEGRPAIVRDMTTDSRVQYPGAAAMEGVISMATVPMVVKGVVTGVLRVYTDEPYDFDDEEIAFLIAAAGVAGAAIENGRIYNGMQDDFDGLIDEIIYMRQSAHAVSRT